MRICEKCEVKMTNAKFVKENLVCKKCNEKIAKEQTVQYVKESMFTDDEVVKFKHLMGLTSSSKDDTLIMFGLHEKFIGHTRSFCQTCPTSVQLVYKRIKAFWNNNKEK